MGDPLSEQSLESFSDELQKLAQGGVFRSVGQFLKTRLRNPSQMGLGALMRLGGQAKGGLIGDLGAAAQRVVHPIQGLREGWQASSPLHVMQEKAKKLGEGSAKELRTQLGRDLTVQEAAQHLKSRIPTEPVRRSFWSKLKTGLTAEEKAHAEAQSEYGKFMQGGEHMLGTKQETGPAQRIAEELSRRGWTGAGPKTKYLPVGNKALMAGFTGMSIPDIINAPRPTQTGEGSTLELGGRELLGAGGMIAGTGLGLVPAMAMWYGAQGVGSRLGRVLDRLRAGASLGTAVNAPSPEEAAEQLQRIQQHYG